MKRITFSADERLIEAARQRAAEEHTTLKSRGPYTRDQMNER